MSLNICERKVLQETLGAWLCHPPPHGSLLTLRWPSDTWRGSLRRSLQWGGGGMQWEGGGGTALWNMLILKETVSRKMCRIALGRKMILPSKSYDYIEYNISSHLYCIKIVSILVGATERQHTGPVSVTPTLHIAASQPLALLPTGT